MRTGAIFARGSCRALRWMALAGMVFALGGGEALSQTVTVTGTGMVDVEDQGYSSRIVVVELDTAVWGNVPAAAFDISGNQTEAVMGLPMSSPGSDTFTVTFVNPVAARANLMYSLPSDLLRQLKAADGTDPGTEPDQVQGFTAAVAEEENDPVLPAIPAITIDGDPTTPAAPAGTLPPVTGGSRTVHTGGSGEGLITYTVSPLTPFGLTVETGPGADFGKIHGPPISIGSLQVTWTATDAAGTPAMATRTFQLTVQGIPATPAAPTVTTAGSGELAVSWVAPTASGSPITHYQVEYKGEDDSVFLPGAPLAVSAGTMTTLTGLTDGTEYEVRVRALNGIGWSEWSAPAMGTPTAGGTPMASGDLTFMPATQPDITSGVIMGTAIAAMQLPTVTTGMGTAPYTYRATGLPAGLTVAPATGMLTGTPTAAAGTAMVTYTATDSSSPAALTGSLMFTITVAPAGTPPLIPTGTPSAQRLRSVTVGQLREGGQAQATVTLTGPVERGRIFKARLRLVGQMHTRQSGIGVGTLASQPYRTVGGVRVPLTGELTNADYDADVIGEVTIQPGYSSGAVTIYTGTDPDAEDERLLLQAIKDPQTFMPNSDARPTGGVEKVFMVEDSHTQGYVLTSVPSKIYEAGPFTTLSTLHFTPNFVRDDVPVFVTLTSSHPAYSALFTNNSSTMKLPLGGAGVQAWFRLVPERRNPPTPTACDCDGDRKNDEVVVTATVGGDITTSVGGEEVAKTTVTVVDVDKLPEITVTAMTEDGAGPLMELAEGSTYKVKVEANRNQPSGEVTSEDVTVTLALGDDSTAVAEDYRITPSSVKIVGGLNDQSKTFTLEVLAGDGDIGDETLMLDAMVKGGATNGAGTEEKGMLSVTLMDTTTLNVEPRSDVVVQLAVATARNVADGPDDLWTYGDDDLSIKLSELFKLPADGFTTTADAMSADAKVVTAEADDGVVTVTAMGMGTTKVTVTATTAASAAQISPNIATVEFDIKVDELTLVLMLSGPEDMDMMNLIEGGEGAMVTVTANQMVAEDLEVMVMRDRAGSSAEDDDYMLDPMMITIMAGEMMGSTMVMALEDDMPDAGTNDNMPEELVLYGTAEGMEVMGQAKFYIWDMAVPALPIIAQLLLAGLLGIGGFRRYRRR